MGLINLLQLSLLLLSYTTHCRMGSVAYAVSHKLTFRFVEVGSNHKQRCSCLQSTVRQNGPKGCVLTLVLSFLSPSRILRQFTDPRQPPTCKLCILGLWQSRQVLPVLNQSINQSIFMSWGPTGGQQTIKAYSENSYNNVYGSGVHITPCPNLKQIVYAQSID